MAKRLSEVGASSLGPASELVTSSLSSASELAASLVHLSEIPH